MSPDKVRVASHADPPVTPVKPKKVEPTKKPEKIESISVQHPTPEVISLDARSRADRSLGYRFAIALGATTTLATALKALSASNPWFSSHVDPQMVSFFCDIALALSAYLALFAPALRRRTSAGS